MLSLSELKAQNGSGETVSEEIEAPEVEQTEDVEIEESESDVTAEAEPLEEESEAEEQPDWLKEDGKVDPMFTSSDISAAKKKLRAKLERRHESETDELKAEIEALKQRVTAPQVATKVAPRPKYADFDTEEAYEEAVDKWHDDKIEAKLSGRDQEVTQQRQQQEMQQKLSSSVDQHYERAAKLTQDHGISQEVYHTADLAVRQMAENIRPSQGDAVVDFLISHLGDDSEKVMFYVGRNANALNELQSALVGDPSGIQAAMLLGTMKARVAMPKKRQSSAIKPATQIKGDDAAGGAKLERKLKKQYSEAHKAKDPAAAIKAKREAKKAGINVANWS